MHNDLDPHTSAEIICEHVTEGVKMARAARLPSASNSTAAASPRIGSATPWGRMMRSKALPLWAALRPEERWWLFAMTAAEAGMPEDTQRGWRRALFLALSDGEKPVSRKRRPRPVEKDLFELPLFEDSK